MREPEEPEEPGGAAAPAIRELEALGLRVWPPAETVDVDGWAVCLSEGTTRRTNSVQTSAPARGELGLDERIAACEARYRERGLPPVFKLTQASPPELEPALAGRGYVRADPTSVQEAELSGLGGASPGRVAADDVAIGDTLDDGWLAACLRLNEVPRERSAGLRGVMARVPPPRAFASLGRGDATLAQALGVVAGRRLYLCLLATDPARRRAGHGRGVVEALLQWGATRGAASAWLQVVAANSPALALYARLGFRERYRYWYRQPPPGHSTRRSPDS